MDDQELLDIYTDYLISSFGLTTDRLIAQHVLHIRADLQRARAIDKLNTHRNWLRAQLVTSQQIAPVSGRIRRDH